MTFIDLHNPENLKMADDISEALGEILGQNAHLPTESAIGAIIETLANMLVAHPICQEGRGGVNILLDAVRADLGAVLNAALHGAKMEQAPGNMVN